eukprot:1328416-Prymnesium_polylepis.1
MAPTTSSVARPTAPRRCSTSRRRSTSSTFRSATCHSRALALRAATGRRRGVSQRGAWMAASPASTQCRSASFMQRWECRYSCVRRALRPAHCCAAALCVRARAR